MQRPIDPVTLRLFIAVCEEGHIARAAEREAIVASAVSKRIGALEAELSEFTSGVHGSVRVLASPRCWPNSCPTTSAASWLRTRRSGSRCRAWTRPAASSPPGWAWRSCRAKRRRRTPTPGEAR